MPKKLIPLTIAAVTFLMPLVSLAAPSDDPSKVYDGRLEGYGNSSVTLDITGTALTWLLLVGLGVVCLGGMFKHANRSHLD